MCMMGSSSVGGDRQVTTVIYNLRQNLDNLKWKKYFPLEINWSVLDFEQACKQTPELSETGF